MQTIKSESLKEGMIFSAPVFFDDGKNMFLAEQRPVTKFHLNTLKRWQIDYVVTYGKEIKPDETVDAEEVEMLEELESVPSFAGIMRKRLTETSLWQNYITPVQNMQKIYTNYKNNLNIDKTLIDDSVKMIYKLVNEDKEFALNCIFCCLEDTPFYPASAVDTAVLCAVLGVEQSLGQRTLIHIITAALIRDLEMSKIPDSILHKKEKLTSTELELFKVHPQKTARYASEFLMYPREVIAILMQHHEHWDGTGYPEGRRGENIDPCARILRVCDAFYTMVAPQPEGKAMLAYDAVKNLLDAKEKMFGPNALKAFVRSIGLYPPGTFVLLSDSSIAQVVTNNPDAPFAPTVQIIASSAESKEWNEEDKKGRVINLNVQKSFFIVRAVNPGEDKTLV